MGPGGGVQVPGWGDGGGGGYLSKYGNPSILPLIGGSGGGGSGGSAGGAGGSILIGASGTITVTGGLYAKGGSGTDYSGGGSGGAVRLIPFPYNNR